MAVCVVCGKENENIICDRCKETTDLEKLAMDILHYDPNSEGNEIWHGIASGLKYPSHFRDVAFAVASEIASPRREYIRLLCVSGDRANVRKESRPWLYEVCDTLEDADGLSKFERNRIKGLKLGALYMDYQYEEAEKVATELWGSDNLPAQAYINIADFFLKTRRYDMVSDVIGELWMKYGDDASIQTEIDKLKGELDRYKHAASRGKKEYMPAPQKDKDVIRKKYVDFLASIGIEAEMPELSAGKYVDDKGRRLRYPIPIPKDQYPEIKEVREPKFDSFVAYDFETTGVSSTYDAIIEVGAIKVVGGCIVEEAEFVFQEYVKPFKKGLPEHITELTGIRKEDVSKAREMWEVFPDFAKFVGDDVLVGFNNIVFDSKFLARAARYSNLLIDNPQFDVMHYAQDHSSELGMSKSISLGDLSKELEIENPRAHRALADAITTARVFLKLKEKFDREKKSGIDDLLAGIDDW